MSQNLNLLYFLFFLTSFLSLHLVSLGALVEMDELVLGLRLVKLIDVGGYANLIFLLRAVLFFRAFVRLKVPIVLV